MEMDRQKVTELIVEHLRARHNVRVGDVSVTLRKYGGTGGEAPSLIAFVRLNTWRPDLLLRGSLIERGTREHVRNELGLRIGYVFWRIASSVATPAEATQRFPARASPGRVKALEDAAAAAGAAPPVDAPVTDWADAEHTLPMEYPGARAPQD